jgi:hypothetical protein
VIRIIGVRDARCPCTDYSASLVPNSESDVDGSYAANTQRSSGKGKDYSLRDSVRSIASGHRSFDLFCYNIDREVLRTPGAEQSQLSGAETPDDVAYEKFIT